MADEVKVPTATELTTMTKEDLAKLQSDLSTFLPVLGEALKAAEEKAVADAAAAEKAAVADVKAVEKSFAEKYGNGAAHGVEIALLIAALLKMFNII